MPKWERCRHANAATRAFGGAPYGATNRARGVPKWVQCRHANAANGAFGEAPDGATERVRGVPKCGRCRHANAGTLAFDGAPYGATYGATKRVRDVLELTCGGQREGLEEGGKEE